MDQVTATPGAAPAAPPPVSPIEGANDVRSGISQILNTPSGGETQSIAEQVGELLEQATQSSGLEQAAADVLDKAGTVAEAPVEPPPADDDDDEAEPEAPQAGVDPAQAQNQPLGKSARRNAAYGWAKQIASAYHGQELKTVTPDQLPTVEEFKAMRDAHNALSAISFDFNQATPEAHEQFLARLNQTNPEAMARLASHMVKSLPKVNQQAYTALASPIARGIVERMYREAEAEPNLEAKQSLGIAAQILEYQLTGKRYYRPLPYLQGDGQGGQQPQPQAGMTPEMRAILAENQQYRQMHEQSERQAQAQQAEARLGQFDGTVSTEVGKEVEAALAPLANVYKGNPKVFEALQSKFRQDVESAIEANPNMAQFVQQRQIAVQTGDEQHRNAALSRFRQMLNAAIAVHKAAYYRSSRQQMEPAQQARHEQLRQVADVRHPAPTASAPGGASAPVDLSQARSARDGIRMLLRS